MWKDYKQPISPIKRFGCFLWICLCLSGRIQAFILPPDLMTMWKKRTFNENQPRLQQNEDEQRYSGAGGSGASVRSQLQTRRPAILASWEKMPAYKLVCGCSLRLHNNIMPKMSHRHGTQRLNFLQLPWKAAVLSLWGCNWKHSHRQEERTT